MKTRSSRFWISLAAAAGLLLFFVYAFWPRPLLVDLAQVQHQPMRQTIDEIARTRVRDAYLVSAPVAGHLLRVQVEAGDRVVGDETVIARMLPVPPSALDVRTREQANAAVNTARAALRMAQAELNKATADRDLAAAELERAEMLQSTGAVSFAELERAQRQMRAADAQLDTADAAIAMREAEIAAAEALLIQFRDGNAVGDLSVYSETEVPLYAPISGQVLRVMQRSETTLGAGSPILEIGDVSNDLEVLTELLSTDAVQVKAGDPVIIDNWGGGEPLHGVVERVEPWGFTKFSALGVEEQRVNTIIQFDEPVDARASLGHGYRVEARIVVWQDDNALVVPVSALFRDAGQWAVFVNQGGKARLRQVTIGHQNGIQAEVVSGLEAGEQVVMYPPSGLQAGDSIRAR